MKMMEETANFGRSSAQRRFSHTTMDNYTTDQYLANNPNKTIAKYDNTLAANLIQNL